MSRIIRPMVKALAANSVETAFAAKIPTATKPAGVGVFDVLGEGTLDIQPFGAGADDSTFSMRVWGWRKTSGTDLWVPKCICTLDVVLSTAVGVAGEDALNTDRFADAITLAATLGGMAILESVPANTPASAVVDVSPYELYELDFDLVTATSANALVENL